MHVMFASATASANAFDESTAARWAPVYPQPNLLSPTAVGEAGGSGGASGGGGDGGGGEGKGGGEGEIDWTGTTNDAVPLRRPQPSNEKLRSKPGAAHSAPFQPSPYESVMVSVHVALEDTASGQIESYGLPPLSVVLSEQFRAQPTSHGQPPPEQVITEKAACVPVAFCPQEL